MQLLVKLQAVGLMQIYKKKLLYGCFSTIRDKISQRLV